MAVAARPGLTSGSEMVQKLRHSEQPSIQEASSSATGTAAKKVCISQMTIARLNVRYTIASPITVSCNPSQRQARKKGMVKAIGGAMRVTKIHIAT